MNKASVFTICPQEDVTSLTPDPEPSQPPPLPCMEQTAEPTSDGEPRPAGMPELEAKIEPTISPKPEPHKESDKVCEPAILCITVGLHEEYKGHGEKSPAHTPTGESELQLVSIYFEEME